VKYVLMSLVLVSAPLVADDIYLKGGGEITGQITAQSEKSVTIDIGGGSLTVQMSQVVRIEKNVSPLQEYRTRAAKIAAGDAEGWRALARWARDQALATEARKAWKEVLHLLPDDAEANRALGHVELNGQWVTEEESYRARGFVEFEGQWVSPEERQTILDARHAQSQQEQAALQAQIQAEQQARQDYLAQKQAEDAEFWREAREDDWYYDDAFYWGSGVAPVYWPNVPGRRLNGPARPARPATLPSGGGGRRR
jgi:hypothetical protein